MITTVRCRYACLYTRAIPQEGKRPRWETEVLCEREGEATEVRCPFAENEEDCPYYKARIRENWEWGM